MDTQKLLKSAIEKYGRYSQIEMLIEECSEVIHAVQKYKRGISEDEENNLLEELADLSIVMDQMRMIFPAEKIDLYRTQKLERLERRLAE